MPDIGRNREETIPDPAGKIKAVLDRIEARPDLTLVPAEAMVEALIGAEREIARLQERIGQLEEGMAGLQKEFDGITDELEKAREMNGEMEEEIDHLEDQVFDNEPSPPQKKGEPEEFNDWEDEDIVEFKDPDTSTGD